MIAVDEAIARIVARSRTLAVETVPAGQALGRVLAADVLADVALPPFDNAAMDGFALACGGGVLAAGREFEVVGVRAAGDARIACGDVCRIMTGAALPAGLDAVVPVEQVEVLARDPDGAPVRIRLNEAVSPGQHVRRAGEDVTPGARVLSAGTRIGAVERLALAALGVGVVGVRRRPRVMVISTGRELVDDPAQPLAPGRIRNANGPYLAAALAQSGAELVGQVTILDDPGHYLATLQAGMATGCDVVISTGAVSMGEFDFVPDALARIGAEPVFHKVAMRPGKPLLFAVLPGGALYFGLPGNPVSAAVGLRFFVEPALRAMLGRPRERPLRVPLANAVRKKPGFRLFQKAALRIDRDGRAGVTLLPGQESFRIRPLLDANAWAVLPEDADLLPAGTPVEVFGLQPDTLIPYGDD
ncbi:molybdopterin molybdotransferase MoeA [Rehaibacterium terrae]|jgi:molybdopterin molybdotransferase|uniref:Molybdopterin molybdenumtransferase n=1 Tax=Rehaibacterium terrae TaxID=1341696 RepID=A0A7W7Y1L1_9GAMM|nr:gephyrin-like molybdotransferase Glp [Rehaibacterium terrae]MBB5016431.1 molybdopterin molybdotransferase [Rehaibacterium terrae]